MASALTDAMTKVVEVIAPLTSEERVRVIQAAMALLGEQAAPLSKGTKVAAPPAGDWSDVAPAAVTWLSKNGLTRQEIEQWFHLEADKTTALALAGNATNRSEQAINTYLMLGFAAFLARGDSSFTDRDARDLCEHFGCYDESNHAKIFREFGNRVTGSKTAGWKLTAPGLAAVATLLRS